MSAQARILVLDDEPAMLENCRRLLTSEGYECITLQDPLRVREVLRDARPDLLLLDLRMPAADGMTVLSAAVADGPTLPVIVITAYASLGSAVQAMREGAFDYLAKPFTADQLLVAVERALRYRGLSLENEALRAQVVGSAAEGIVGSSPGFLHVLEQARKVARTEANVLITGESGTGKEVLARFIHAESPRKARLFTPVDCAALPEGLLESELFGHERGAFTGAVSRKDGLLTVANGGTAFLDEITEMSPGLQSKLLRALEDRKIRRLGSSEFVEIDLRIIAATNVDLESAVASGAFRHDLYYRLSVVPFCMPPLRDRAGDVPLLMQVFLRKFAAELDREPPQVSPDVWKALEAHDWPGNVRELQNLARRLVALDDHGRLTLADLPENIRGPGLPRTNGSAGECCPWLVEGGNGEVPAYELAREQALRRFQTEYVRELLAQHAGSVTRAARAAAVSRRTFHRWLAELGPDARGEQP
jgi:two-component system, NtrC family, nitrogen regulation response regulator NtrX